VGVLGEGIAGDILIERKKRRCSGVEFVGVAGLQYWEGEYEFMLYAGDEGGVVAVAPELSSGTGAGGRVANARETLVGVWASVKTSIM
jgi:hypothetical protein